MTDPDPTYTANGETLPADTVDELRQRLMEVHRDAVSIARQVENMLDMPAEQRAVRTRAERRRVDRRRSNR